MTCRAVRRRLSAHLDGGLAPPEARAVGVHLGSCGACSQRWRTLRGALEMLSEMPRLSSPEGIASRVRDRLEVESRGPGLALLFRPPWAARPLILPSLIPAALVLITIVAATLALHGRVSGPDLTRGEAWPMRLPPSGTEANPLFPSAEVSVPRVRATGPFPEYLLSRPGEGTLFVETVVARDGSVSTVTLLDGDRTEAEGLLDALRRQRFEPARYRGRPVAVSVYRLISRMEVRAPLT